MAEYDQKDYPWTFYFNGVALPKWAANWSLFAPENRDNWDWEIGPRDFHIIRNRISHVGVVESASPHVFLYVVQEILCVLFTEKKEAWERIRRGARDLAEPEEIYTGLVDAAFEMRERTKREYQAFWISGYEADRLRLVEAMRRAALPPNNPEHIPPPHMVSRQRMLDQLWKDQIKVLHHAAMDKHVPQEIRKKLLAL